MQKQFLRINQHSQTRSFLCVIITLSFLYWFGINAAVGQNISGQSKKKTSCNVNDIKFSCPDYFTSIPIETDSKSKFFRHKQYELGLFIGSPESGFDERQLTNDLTKTIISRLFPKESETYAWKSLESSGAISKYEVNGISAQGFNSKLRISLNYHHLVINKKDIIIGYVWASGRGQQAKDLFEHASGGDSMPGCNASVEIISSITGEKFDFDNTPCQIVVKT